LGSLRGGLAARRWEMIMAGATPYTTVRYVDDVDGNFLFRGGETLLSNVFDYAGLKAAIAQAPNLPPRPLPDQYYLVVINLLHSNEVANIEAGVTFFGDVPNPDGFGQVPNPRGQFHLWDTNGTSDCYFSMDPQKREERVEVLEEWLPDPLIWRVATIRRWLEHGGQSLPTPPPNNYPLVIYVHCDGGCDRTGEMIGAYRLRYMAYSWMEMWREQPCGRPMGCNNYRAVQWYAFWLNKVLNRQITGIGEDGGCSDPQGPWNACSPPSA